MKFDCAHDELLSIQDERLKPNPKNNNRHPVDQIERLAQIIAYQGQRAPIVISNQSGFIVKGHARLQAIQKLGWEKVAVNFQSYEDPDQEYADMTADNAIASWAELDYKQINYDLQDLGPDFKVEYLGMRDFTLDPFEQVPGCDEDEVPSEPVTPKTVLGDVYQLGNHRLVCGDATNATDVQRLLENEVPKLMVTDPPYGVKLDQSWRDEALGSKALGKGNKNLVTNDDRADWYDAWVLFPGSIAYVWHASSFTDVVMDSLRRADFEIKQQIIWNKSVMVMGRQAYHWKHEPCWYAIKKGCDQNWQGDRKQTTVWDAAPPTHIMGGSKDDKTEHPTQKPISIYEIPISNHTHPGDAVYEPFGGSGSAIIACEKLKRRSLTMELSPKYCDVIVSRYCKFAKTKEVYRNGELIEWE